MNKVKVLKTNEIYSLYNPDGQLKKGIKKINFQQTHPFIVLPADKEELTKTLNKKYELGITELLGIRIEEGVAGFYWVYYKSI